MRTGKGEGESPPDRRFSEEALDLMAQRFKALSDPLRLRLILALMSGERNVSSLVAATGAHQGNVSRQLATLKRAGIVKRRKAGLSVYYSIVDGSVFDLCDLVCGSVARFHEDQASVFKS